MFPIADETRWDEALSVGPPDKCTPRVRIQLLGSWLTTHTQTFKLEGSVSPSCAANLRKMLPYFETFWNNTSSQRRRSAPTVTSWFSSHLELTLHRDGLTINRRLTMPTMSHRGPDLLDTHASSACRAPTRAPGSALGNLHNFFHDPWDGDVENVDGPPRRSGSENNHLNPGSPRPRTSTKKSSRKIRRIFIKPSSRLIVV